MKIIKAIIVSLTLAVIAAPSAFAFSISPNPQTQNYVENSPSTADCSQIGSSFSPLPRNILFAFYSDGTQAGQFSNEDCESFVDNSVLGTNVYGNPVSTGNYHWLLMFCDSGQCSSAYDYNTTLSSGATLVQDYVFLVSNNAPPVKGIVDNASTTMASALGFSPGNVADFMLTQALLVIGSGLGIFRILLSYVMAMIFIGIIVYFIYAGFRD